MKADQGFSFIDKRHVIVFLTFLILAIDFLNCFRKRWNISLFFLIYVLMLFVNDEEQLFM